MKKSKLLQFNDELEGRVLGHRDGHGFVLRDDGGPDVYLSPQEMRAVMHRDRVRFRVAGLDRRGRPEGKVVDILERQAQSIIGRLLQDGGAWVVAPEDRRYGQDILIAPKGLGSAQVGQVVVVELTDPPALYAQPMGRVSEVLGEVDDPGMEIEIAVRKYGVPHEFSDKALRLAAALPEKIRAFDKRGRVDLTDVPLVTIDGEDARDFDDAVYCEPCEWGKGRQAKPGWRLLVAIADVSHYVRPGDALDEDAYERATSVYFPRRVIPMLPEKISNGLCSLNPYEERLSMVCDMVVDADGEVQAFQFYPAVICSHERFTYTTVAAILANTPAALNGPHAHRVQDLVHLHHVYRALLKSRQRRGAVDFETTETQIVCDSNGRIEKIVPRTRNEAHRLIEEAMLAANVCAADFILGSKHDGLYRVHEGPTPEKRQLLQNYLRSLGLGFTLSEDPSPAELAAIAHQTADRPDAQQIHTMLLRSMQQAIYTGVNSGHFGLAYGAYTHFTSPIRRYPDLLVHRVIKSLLTGKRYELDAALIANARPMERRGGSSRPSSAAPGKPDKAGAPIKTAKSKSTEAWTTVGAHCSANERRADEASRDVEAWLKCRYMRDRLGEVFGGTVSAVTGFGLFVTLDELYVEGLIHITELGGEYFSYDEARQELRGERTGMRHRVGQKLWVQVSRVDLDARKIDFRWVDSPDAVGEAGHQPPGSASGKRPAKEESPTLEGVREQDRQAKHGLRQAQKEWADVVHGGKHKKSTSGTAKGKGKAPGPSGKKSAAKGRGLAGLSSKSKKR